MFLGIFQCWKAPRANQTKTAARTPSPTIRASVPDPSSPVLRATTAATMQAAPMKYGLVGRESPEMPSSGKMTKIAKGSRSPKIEL